MCNVYIHFLHIGVMHLSCFSMHHLFHWLKCTHARVCAARTELQVAIMGPSGAGKTSLLNSLAQRNANFGGEVLLNGEPWREAFFSVLAYMPQDEMFLHELTPREHLSYMAQLRVHQKSLAVQVLFPFSLP